MTPGSMTQGLRRRQRPVHPHAAANQLAMQHLDLAEKIAGNFARRTSHPRDDLLQLATLGLIKAARRYQPSRGPFRPYARTFANGEITHFLRDHGFLLTVPPSWRELHARGQKLIRNGANPAAVPQALGITTQHWQQIAEACAVTVVAMPLES
ncbi:MAG: sigma-70 family RNA polymerase sigma factor, partial [Synechococcus lacustris]